MISGLDHIVVLLADIAEGTAAYETLLGCAPSWRNSGDGADRALFTLPNMTLELMAASGSSVAADRIRTVIGQSGEGLASICFATPDIEKMHRRLERVALKPEPVAEVESHDFVSGAALRWKRTRAATELARGVRMFFLELEGQRPRSKRRLRHRSRASTTSSSPPRIPSALRRCTARGSASTWRSTAPTTIGASSCSSAAAISR